MANTVFKGTYHGFGLHHTGDWRKVARGLRDLNLIAPESVHEEMGNFAGAIIDRARYAIYTKGRSLGEDWQDNSEETVSSKGFNFPYIETKKLYKNLQLTVNGVEYRRKVLGSRRRFTVFEINVSNEIHNREWTYADIATILEFGAHTPYGEIPPRPLWTPLNKIANVCMTHIVRRRKLTLFDIIHTFGGIKIHDRHSIKDYVNMLGGSK